MTERPLAERAHDRLHKLPGMPEHGERTRRNHQGGLPNRPLRNRPLRNRPLRNRSRQSPRINHGHQEPKVLVSWQNAIARFFSGGSR